MDKKMFVGIFAVVFTIMLSSFTFYTWQIIYSPNILVGRENQLFPVYAEDQYPDIQDRLYKGGYVNDMVSFSFLAKLKKYPSLIKPGMYLLKGDMTNIAAINLLRSGSQEPIELTFSYARTIDELPEKIARFMAFDEAEFADFLLRDSTAYRYGFEPHNFIAMFLPNTYEVYWTATPQEVLDRLHKEYKNFWTAERKGKAETIGLTPLEVSTLASIVEGETNKMDEAPLVAGVYVNRLKRGIKLQADPTLVFATGDFSIRRVLNVHKQIDSPYNTYKYAGLPPGPIALPSPAAIDAVLNHAAHKYLYFCAKDDFSGYHAFARTLSEHNENARKFQQALDREKIFR